MTEQWQELKETIIELRDNNGTATQQEVCKFLANLMDVLEKQMQEPCEDAISRQIISDYVESHIQEINTGYGDLNKHTNEILRMIVDYIEKMESVTPQPKIGHWIMHEKHRECSKCTVWLPKDMPRNSFCPNCGVKMEEEDGKIG